MTTYGPRHTHGQKKKRDLERKVLARLKKFGPPLYSLRFDTNHPAEIQPILRGLREYGYIDVTGDKMVTITTFGLQQLK